jgi:DNA-binding CsgD family transcriptional regulator
LLDDPVATRCLFLDEPAAAAWVVRAGDAWEAEIATRTVERLAADSPGISSLTAAALHAGGLLRRDTNALEQAALRHTRPWDRASALEDLSVLCGPVPLTHALSAYEAAGSARDAARVRSRLASANGRQTRRESGPRRRALFGWNALTPNERAVADLVAEGLTNAEVGRKLCLSRHTVDFHLRQIFLKLGITSRVVLTRMVVDQDARSSAMNSPTP